MNRRPTALQGFYAVTLLVSLVGASQAAAGWLGWPIEAAVLAVAVVELGGAALLWHADHRRRTGERAIVVRLLSAAVAAGAVTAQVLGHTHPGQAAFFGGLSALGYFLAVADSEARRRDRLRAENKLPATAPVYGLWSWLRHPGLTRRARGLALADPGLGPVGSLAAAREQVRAEKRTAAIAGSLRKRIAEHVDPRMATIAVNTFDLDAIADRLAQGADYDGLAGILAAELVPARLAPVGDTKPAQRRAEQPEPATSGDTVTPAVSRPRSTWTRHAPSVRSRRLSDIRRPHVTLVVSPPEPARGPRTEPSGSGQGGSPDGPRSGSRKRPATAAQRINAALAKEPNASLKRLAEMAAVSVSTVKRHRSTDGSPDGGWSAGTRVNGHSFEPAG